MPNAGTSWTAPPAGVGIKGYETLPECLTNADDRSCNIRKSCSLAHGNFDDGPSPNFGCKRSQAFGSRNGWRFIANLGQPYAQKSDGTYCTSDCTVPGSSGFYSLAYEPVNGIAKVRNDDDSSCS